MEEYLKHYFNISVESLVDALKLVDEETRFRIEALWSEAHRGRRNENGNGNGNVDFDESVTEALIKHDVESYVGIIEGT